MLLLVEQQQQLKKNGWRESRREEENGGTHNGPIKILADHAIGEINLATIAWPKTSSSGCLVAVMSKLQWAIATMNWAS